MGIDEWSNKGATAAMLENPSLSAHSSTVLATQKDQQASWDHDPYRIRHTFGAVIPQSTHSPPPYQSPGPEGIEAHSQTNHGLATNTHALVGDEPNLGDLQTVTHQLTNDPNDQQFFEHLFSLWEGTQPPSVGPQFTSDSGHPSPASLPPYVIPFYVNPYPPSSKTAPQPWHQDAITLDNAYNPRAESSAAQEEHHTLMDNCHSYPTGHSAAEPMSHHPPLPHPPAQAGPEIQTAYSQNAGLGTRSHLSELFGHEPDSWDFETIFNQLNNGPGGQDSFEHLISLSPSSAPHFMPHSSHTNLASGFSHFLQVPENSQQPSFKTTPPQSKRRTRQRIPTLKPSPNPLKKQTPRAKKIWPKHSSGLSERTHLIQIDRLAPGLGALRFDWSLFQNVSPLQDSVQHPAGGQSFQVLIEQLPGKSLTIPEDEFNATYMKYIEKTRIPTPGISTRKYNQSKRLLEDKLLEFQKDMELWYHRWLVITSFDFNKERPLPKTNNYEMGKIVEVVFCAYLFYVEMICSIVPRKSTTSRDLATELKSARQSFANLSSDPSELLKKRNLSLERFDESRQVTLFWVKDKENYKKDNGQVGLEDVSTEVLRK
ncbi:uncharacterized protein VP01_1372g4 [Puccinia sorghi]|uniref:Uncharacterized protein n=1 Tax=Puccinia sorghi TaxID=27349 RepID=A0A0L6VM54_9BASI|nr:uncharacterized protein VP01_1372g4 [Puccinia sorghi]